MLAHCCILFMDDLVVPEALPNRAKERRLSP